MISPSSPKRIYGCDSRLIIGIYLSLFLITNKNKVTLLLCRNIFQEKE